MRKTKALTLLVDLPVTSWGSPCSEKKSFWIAWSSRFLRIGKGLVPGESVFVSARAYTNAVRADRVRVQVESSPTRVFPNSLAEWLIYRQPDFTSKSIHSVDTQRRLLLLRNSMSPKMPIPGWRGWVDPNPTVH